MFTYKFRLFWKENKALLESEEMSRYNSVEPHLEEGRKRGSSISAKEGERVQIFYVNVLSLLAGVFYKNGAFAEYTLKLHSLRPTAYIAMKYIQGTS